MINELKAKQLKELELINKLNVLLRKKHHSKTRIMLPTHNKRVLKYNAPPQKGGERNKRFSHITHDIRRKLDNLSRNISDADYPIREVGHKIGEGLRYFNPTEVKLSKDQLYANKVKVDSSRSESNILLLKLYEDSLKEKYNISDYDKELIKKVMERYTKNSANINLLTNDIYNTLNGVITSNDPHLGDETNLRVSVETSQDPLVIAEQGNIKIIEKELEKIELKILENVKTNAPNIDQLETKRERDIILAKLNAAKKQLDSVYKTALNKSIYNQNKILAEKVIQYNKERAAIKQVEANGLLDEIDGELNMKRLEPINEENSKSKQSLLEAESKNEETIAINTLIQGFVSEINNTNIDSAIDDTVEKLKEKSTSTGLKLIEIDKKIKEIEENKERINRILNYALQFKDIENKRDKFVADSKEEWSNFKRDHPSIDIDRIISDSEEKIARSSEAYQLEKEERLRKANELRALEEDALDSLNAAKLKESESKEKFAQDARNKKKLFSEIRNIG